jgi:TRAP-type C4-dicarboxylate transport system permease small subunit
MDRISNFLTAATERLIALLISFMIILVFAQVLFRYVIHIPFPGTEELVTNMVIWNTFLAAALAIKRNRHLTIDIFTKKFPPRFLRYYEIFVQGLISIYTVIVFAMGLKYVLISWEQVTEYFEIPMSIPYGIFPVSAGLMIFYLVESIIKKTTGRGED